MDVDSIAPGADFVNYIDSALSASDVMAVLIGNNWLSSADSAGRQRLHDPGDFVRTEIASALQQKIKIIPVLLNGAAMPNAKDLPSVLSELPNKQGVKIAGNNFEDDVQVLIHAIEREFHPPSIKGSLSNSGWTLYFEFPDQHPREIFYKIAGELEFKSTGTSSLQADSLTGLPAPNLMFIVPNLVGATSFLIKYVDRYGDEHGPYEVPFNPTEHFLNEVKQILDMVAWVAFREYPEGELNVYFSSLLVYKSAFREIRYSINEDSVSKRLQFTPVARGPRITGIGDNDEAFMKLPLSTKFVAVQLVFVDGSTSPIKTFKVSEATE